MTVYISIFNRLADLMNIHLITVYSYTYPEVAKTYAFINRSKYITSLILENPLAIEILSPLTIGILNLLFLSFFAS